MNISIYIMPNDYGNENTWFKRVMKYKQHFLYDYKFKSLLECNDSKLLIALVYKPSRSIQKKKNK